MDEQNTSNTIDNEETILNNQESDYKNLITKLKEINLTIALLKKQYLDNF